MVNVHGNNAVTFLYYKENTDKTTIYIHNERYRTDNINNLRVKTNV